MIELTEKQENVLRTLKAIYKETGEAVSPTAIGTRLGFPYQSASSKTSPSLKRFVELGLATRTNKGRYIPTEVA